MPSLARPWRQTRCMAKTFGQRWKIIDNAGGGGQGDVFRVKDLQDASTDWILKRLKDPKRLGRFEWEVRALELIDSPHIPKTEDYCLKDPAYHVSPYLGSDLEQYITFTPMDVNHALALFEQIVSVVRDAHATGVVVHRDIKPNNVVVSPDGQEAYLIDFGICQYADGKMTLLTTEEPFGNPAFAAPEGFLGRDEEPGPPCDIYSLGKLFYWMISQGEYINRENLSSAVLKRIAVESELIRFYLARLVRGTVAENSAQRWTVARLLEEIQETRQLLDRVREFENRRQIVLTDGFGVKNSFYRHGSRSATTPNRGNPPADGDIGEAFKIPEGRDVCLETITLALNFKAGGTRRLDSDRS
jgi:serine/threonine protein kinase